MKAESKTSDALAEHLQQVAANNPAAFAALYKATAGKLFGICLRILHDRTEAEDVLQDIFCTVWLKASTFDPAKAHALTWLMVIARNKAIDRLRARQSAQRSERSGVPAELPDPTPSAAALVEVSDERRRLDDCLRELDQSQSAAIRAAFLDGLTYEVLAQAEGVPLGTVKSRIRRGLMRLKACLER